MRSFQKTLLVLFILCIFAACHKTHNTSPSANILPLAIGTNLGYITQAKIIINGDTQVVRIVYNTNNTIDSVIDEYNCVGGTCKTFAITYFSYSGHYIHIFWSTQDPSDPANASAPWQAYRVHLINNGMCDSLYSSEDSTARGSSPEYLKYNGTQIDTFFYLNDYNNHWSVTTAYSYTYNSNGDIAKSAYNDTGYSTYGYDLTHATQMGDPAIFNQLTFYGIVYTRCAHLTTSVGNNATTYKYTFDSKGRVATANETDISPSDTNNIYYIYQYKD